LIILKLNILIDDTGNARLADFGLLTIISDPKNYVFSSTGTHGGTARWMGPELIDPPQFGLKRSRPTKASDCYAFGMVIYETISGHQPFHEDKDLGVFVKVLRGERPRRGDGFTDGLWGVVELCWVALPHARPTVAGVFRLLKRISNSPVSLGHPASRVGEEVLDDEDGWDSISDSSGAFSSCSVDSAMFPV
jgi:serine/threonine protein kinase